MSSTEDTQDLSGRSPRTRYQYYMRATGRRNVTSPTTFLVENEYGTEVVNSITGDVMSVHWNTAAWLSEQSAQEQCAIRNAVSTAEWFPIALMNFIDNARESGNNSGDILEDVDTIINWHLKCLRGLSRKPLDLTIFNVLGAEFNA